MIVKIKDKYYDSSKEPIMLILSPSDKDNIRNMKPEYKKYCSYPEGISTDEIKKFMDEKGA